MTYTHRFGWPGLIAICLLLLSLFHFATASPVGYPINDTLVIRAGGRPVFDVKPHIM